VLTGIVIGVLKTEVIHHDRPWRSFDDVKHAPQESVA